MMANTQFRTRSAERDNTQDAARFGSVAQAIEKAIQESRKELTGLELRLNLFGDSFAAQLDQSAAFGERPRSEEAQISATERALVAGRQRATTLRRNLDFLAELQVRLEAYRADSP